jgi:hypothetical protein
LWGKNVDAGANKFLVTLVKDPDRRQKQWSFHMPILGRKDEGGFYKRSVPCGIPEFKCGTDAMTEQQALDTAAQWGLVEVPIDNGHPEIHALLVAEAERLGLPKHYRDDVYVYDKIILCSPGYTCTEFIWLLRTMGSHFMHFQGDDRMAYLKAMNESGDADRHWYYFNGGRLQPIDYERAVRITRDREHENARRSA